ncbi:MAG: ATP synthase F1 subunit gamma [Spirochaetaceae bacterium]|jgi:F-type H+-transporting ATPase subunit gamma|nr:ATP synthase F1 subunit gamma [Spirochaetaceae bacterium]
MANLRDVRLRMRAIKQTLQVTNAMKLISTAKLRKGRRILEDTEPFFTRIQKSMYDIVSGSGHGGLESVFFKNTEAMRGSQSAVVVVTSDKGLAGGYNANLFREAKKTCEALSHPALILIGSIGYRYFAHTPYGILENFSFESRLPTMEDAQELTDYIISQYLWGVFKEVHIVYTHMYSTVKLLPRTRQMLPLNEDKIQEAIAQSGGEKRVSIPFEYLPSESAVFDALIPFYLKGLIYGSLVEAHVSEQSARMAAMEEASKNAQEMLDSLGIYYNRVRQAGITQEVTEIISGSAVLSE